MQKYNWKPAAYKLISALFLFCFVTSPTSTDLSNGLMLHFIVVCISSHAYSFGDNLWIKKKSVYSLLFFCLLFNSVFTPHAAQLRTVVLTALSFLSAMFVLKLYCELSAAYSQNDWINPVVLNGEHSMENWMNFEIARCIIHHLMCFIKAGIKWKNAF